MKLFYRLFKCPCFGEPSEPLIEKESVVTKGTIVLVDVGEVYGNSRVKMMYVKSFKEAPGIILASSIPVESHVAPIVMRRLNLMYDIPLTPKITSDTQSLVTKFNYVINRTSLTE